MIERQGHAARHRIAMVGSQIVTRRVRPARASVDARRLACLRQGAYRLLSAALLYPERPFIDAAAHVAGHLRRTSSWSAQLAMYLPLERFLQYTEALGPDNLEALQQQYMALFGSSLVHQSVPLCESAYLAPESMALSRVIADLEKQYASVGLSASAEGAIPADHAAVELEFVSFLCKKEQDAWAARDLHSVLETIARQKSFIEQHPGLWIPLLAAVLSRRGQAHFYELAVQAARALVLHDAVFLEVLFEYLNANGEILMEGGES